MSNLHDRLNTAFVMITSYINEGQDAQAFSLLERVVNKEMYNGTIRLTDAEIQSGLDRQKAAEGLILQLPKDHDGRNTWLLNFGTRKEAIGIRVNKGIRFSVDKCAAIYEGNKNESSNVQCPKCDTGGGPCYCNNQGEME